MKYILSPLLFENISDIEPLAKDILEYDGINFLFGKAKVGKTALVYKLMHWWLVQEKLETPYFITRKKMSSYQYWDSKFCQLHIPVSTFLLFNGIKRINYASTKNTNDPAKIILLALLEEEIKKTSNYLIIIEDWYGILSDSNSAYTRLLLLQLNTLRIENKAKVLFTGRSKRKIERVMEIVKTEQQEKFEYRYLRLERPAYIEDEIKEFGECRVWMGE